jgi:catechol 2,3-dioxygenase-like lactoylglutathione lyase family enzyme
VDSPHGNQSRKLFAGRRILSHIDLRVRERERALEFYDAIFAPLGIFRSGDGSGTGEWVSYDTIPESDDYPMEWFAFTVDHNMTAGPTRIAFHAATREEVDIVAVAARRLCVEPIEGPEEIYGYYAVFFLDPDGNRLEVCCLQ